MWIQEKKDDIAGTSVSIILTQIPPFFIDEPIYYMLFSSVADPDPVGSGLFWVTRIRILYPQKTPVIQIFSLYKIV